MVDSILHTPIHHIKSLRIDSIWRKGKLLVFELSGGTRVLSHLGMTGGWRVSAEACSEKHTHIEFSCSGSEGSIFLSYVDPRRFGHMYVLSEEESLPHLNKLGVDVSSKDFTSRYLRETFKRFPQRKIKVHLLDQAIFAGVGNYMASEICALAGIRPTRRNSKITLAESEGLFRAFSTVIEGALETSGTTFQGGYADTTGEKGQGVQNLVVFYQKDCQMCGGPVKKVFLAQRGTYYCPTCQK